MALAKPAIDLAKLTADLLEARKAAEAAIKGARDGGTCCFDCPTLRIPWSRSKRVNSMIDAAFVAAGFRPGAGYGWSRGSTMLHGFPGDCFQGGPRTKGAETVAAFLASRGWSASVHYAMD